MIVGPGAQRYRLRVRAVAGGRSCKIRLDKVGKGLQKGVQRIAK
jgi:hypothetical protein